MRDKLIDGVSEDRKSSAPRKAPMKCVLGGLSHFSLCDGCGSIAVWVSRCLTRRLDTFDKERITPQGRRPRAQVATSRVEVAGLGAKLRDRFCGAEAASAPLAAMLLQDAVGIFVRLGVSDRAIGHLATLTILGKSTSQKAFAAAIILTLLAVGAMPAGADDSWINWGGYKSPIDGTRCCGANDCFVIPASEVRISPGGYLLKSGELVPYIEAQPSEDQSYWRCKRYDGTRRCFFAPQPGS